MPTKLYAYKAFKPDMTCRDFQYEVGKTYVHDGEVLPCIAGFHACEKSADVLQYYDATTSRFAKVILRGTIEPHGNKIVANEITIVEELTLEQLIEESNLDCHTTKEFAIVETCDPDKAVYMTGANSRGTTRSRSTPVKTFGDKSSATTHGDVSCATTWGNNSISTTTGAYLSHAIAHGAQSKAFTTGDVSLSFTRGENSIATATGANSSACAWGDNSEAKALGNNSSAGAGHGGHITITEYDGGVLVNTFSGPVGANGIKPYTCYKLVRGIPVEIPLYDESTHLLTLPPTTR